MEIWRNVSHVSKLNKKELRKKEKKIRERKRKVKQKGPHFGRKMGCECEGGEKREKKRERKGSEKFRFSIRSIDIGPSVFVGVRGKVHLRDESYAWVPKSWSLVKLHEVGNFPTWNFFSLKTM